MNPDEIYFSMISDVMNNNHNISNSPDASQALMQIADSYLKETMLKARLHQDQGHELSQEQMNAFHERAYRDYLDDDDIDDIDFDDDDFDDVEDADTAPDNNPTLPPARLEASINPDFSTPDDRNRLC